MFVAGNYNEVDAMYKNLAALQLCKFTTNKNMLQLHPMLPATDCISALFASRNVPPSADVHTVSHCMQQIACEAFQYLEPLQSTVGWDHCR